MYRFENKYKNQGQFRATHIAVMQSVFLLGVLLQHFRPALIRPDNWDWPILWYSCKALTSCDHKNFHIADRDYFILATRLSNRTQRSFVCEITVSINNDSKFKKKKRKCTATQPPQVGFKSNNFGGKQKHQVNLFSSCCHSAFLHFLWLWWQKTEPKGIYL